MSAQPPERRLAKFLGVFSFGLGVAHLAAPDRLNGLIGVHDSPKTRAIQRAVGVQELSAAQGIFAFSPPTPILWSRVAGDVLHLGLLARALGGRRNDGGRLLAAMGAVAGIATLDLVTSLRYQSAWPKEPTQGEPLPARDDEQHVEASVPGYPSVTIRAGESEIRSRLSEFEIEDFGPVHFTPAPGDRGTEVRVETKKKTSTVKDNLRKLKQVIEVGEVVRSDAAPEGPQFKRQIMQRSAQPLPEKELAKVGGED
jgi:hypothetical protein